MTTTQMVTALDAEIRRLQQVRELLAGAAQLSEKGSAKKLRVASTPAKGEEGGKRKRVLSPEARERIAAAQRVRWAAHAAAKSTGRSAKAGRGIKAGAKRGTGQPAEGAEGTA